MKSTGNDIVALRATNPRRTGSVRFFSRILAAGELSLFSQQAFPDLPFDHYVWLLWSIKESVYKYEQRIRPGLAFAPLKITVDKLLPPRGDVPRPRKNVLPPNNDEFYKAIVVSDARTLYSRSIIRDGMIASVVSEDENFEHTRWGVTSIEHSTYADQSASVRALAIGELNTVLSRNNLRIEKNRFGVPVIRDEEEVLDIPLSLAHHGHYVAWSYLLPAPSPPPALRSLPASPLSYSFE
jgi:phosphopantetheinyl transferase (holo-ACP synthase)